MFALWWIFQGGEGMNIHPHADWIINAYKNNQIVIGTWHIGISSRDMEIEVLKDRIKRGEIDYIDVIQREHPFERFSIP